MNLNFLYFGCRFYDRYYVLSCIFSCIYLAGCMGNIRIKSKSFFYSCVLIFFSNYTIGYYQLTGIPFNEITLQVSSVYYNNYMKVMGNTLIFHINVLSLHTQKNPLINPAGHQEHATLVYIFNFCLELLDSLSKSCKPFFSVQ